MERTGRGPEWLSSFQGARQWNNFAFHSRTGKKSSNAAAIADPRLAGFVRPVPAAHTAADGGRPRRSVFRCDRSVDTGFWFFRPADGTGNELGTYRPSAFPSDERQAGL